MKRIIADKDHPLTVSIPRTINRKAQPVFKTRLAKTTAYANSFVQKYLRTIRDGAADLYTTRKAVKDTNPSYRSDPATKVATKTKMPLHSSRARSNYEVKLHIDKSVRPIQSKWRPVPLH